MSGKKQRYALRSIRQQYTYSVYEIAELFNITPDTVFRWIRNEGLPRIIGSKKYFVHGSDLHTFLYKKNQKHKKSCKPDEIYCCKCRAPKTPNPNSINVLHLANGTFRAVGLCNVCMSKMGKVISPKSWNETHPFYRFANAPSITHDGESKSPPECQTQLEWIM